LHSACLGDVSAAGEHRLFHARHVFSTLSLADLEVHIIDDTVPGIAPRTMLFKGGKELFFRLLVILSAQRNLSLPGCVELAQFALSFCLALTLASHFQVLFFVHGRLSFLVFLLNCLNLGELFRREIIIIFDRQWSC
jgi:hypothetical protein